MFVYLKKSSSERQLGGVSFIRNSEFSFQPSEDGRYTNRNRQRPQEQSYPIWKVSVDGSASESETVFKQVRVMTRAQPTAVFLLLLVFVGQLSALSVRECWHEIFQRWALTPERRETFHRISSARVLVADYSLLRTDIPQLASLSRKQINSWLLENVAFISDKQLEVWGAKFCVTSC
jgi:hypothetical protein